MQAIITFKRVSTHVFRVLTLFILLVSHSVLSHDEQETEEADELEMKLSRSMRFPKIVINEASENGMICVANGVKNPANSLCPGKKGRSTKLKITGSPDLLISINQESAPQVNNGFQFQVTGTPINTTLNDNGKKHIELDGQLQLISKDTVEPGRMSFNYEITVTYQ